MLEVSTEFSSPVSPISPLSVCCSCWKVATVRNRPCSRTTPQIHTDWHSTAVEFGCQGQQARRSPTALVISVISARYSAVIRRCCLRRPANSDIRRGTFCKRRPQGRFSSGLDRGCWRVRARFPCSRRFLSRCPLANFRGLYRR